MTICWLPPRTQPTCARFYTAFDKVFTVKDLGPAKLYVGMGIVRDREKRTNLLRQNFAEHILKEVGFDKPRTGPFATTSQDLLIKQNVPRTSNLRLHLSNTASTLAYCCTALLTPVLTSPLRSCSCCGSRAHMARSMLRLCAGFPDTCAEARFRRGAGLGIGGWRV